MTRRCCVIEVKSTKYTCKKRREGTVYPVLSTMELATVKIVL